MTPSVCQNRLDEMAHRAIEGDALGRQDALALAAIAREAPHELLHAAWRVRSHFFGRTVRLCAIAAGKLGACAEDCPWCAQSAHRAAEKRLGASRTPTTDIVATARRAARQGVSYFGIVNSGRRPTKDDLQAVIHAVRAIHSDKTSRLGLCASLGAIDPPQARRLADAGLRRYHHNLETSRRLFGRLVTAHTYDERLATLAAARQAGMSICCGGLFGLGETDDDRVDLALTIRDQVQPDVVPLNFLHPIPGTALENAQPLDPIDCLSIIALFRLLMPTIDLAVAGGREANLRHLQSWMFYAGATSSMTGDYLTTAGQATDRDLQMIAQLHLEVVTELPAPPNAP